MMLLKFKEETNDAAIIPEESVEEQVEEPVDVPVDAPTEETAQDAETESTDTVTE